MPRKRWPTVERPGGGYGLRPLLQGDQPVVGKGREQVDQSACRDPFRIRRQSGKGESGVELIACQTGLALAGLSADTQRVAAGGLIDLLATLKEDNLLTL